MVMWMEEWNTYTFILFLHLLGTKCPMTLQMRCARASILFGTKNTPLVKWWGYLKPGVIKHAKTLNKSQKLPIFHYASAEEYSSPDFCETLISISKLRLSRKTLISFSISTLNFVVRTLILILNSHSQTLKNLRHLD